MSTRDVLRKAKPKFYPCEISGGTVHVRALSGAGRAAYIELVRKYDPATPPTHEIAALGLCESDGTLTYDSDDEKERAKLLAELSQVDGEDLQKISLKIFEVSGLTKDAAEDASKNS